MSQPALSIVIVNWKSMEYLRGCLNSVETTCAGLKVEIIVVDGASFDGCAEMLADEFPHIIFIQSDENIGFGQCNNLGVGRASAPVVMLLNPDTELQEGTVKILMDELRLHPDAGLIAPRLLNTDRTLQTSCVRAFPTPVNQALDSDFLRAIFPDSALWGVGKAFKSRTPVVVEAVSGACMVLPTEVYRKLGGFHERYFMYGEDMDLCFRLRQAGYSVLHVPAAEIVHHGLDSWDKLHLYEVQSRYPHGRSVLGTANNIVIRSFGCRWSLCRTSPTLLSATHCPPHSPQMVVYPILGCWF